MSARMPMGAGWVLALAMALAACAQTGPARQEAEVVLPLQRAWFEGRLVEYISTDVSDAGMAAMMGVNHAPRLRQALPLPGQPSALERVYKFPGNEQISVFQSAPQPAGPENQDLGYSPLWRVVEVRWVAGRAAQELRSEEAVLAAEARGEVQLTVTDVVVNCPVTRGADGRALRGVR